MRSLTRGLTRPLLVAVAADIMKAETGAMPLPLLPAPENLAAEGISSSEIRVTWDAVEGAQAYSLERCVGSVCTNFSQLVCTSITEQVHSTLAPNLNVSYRVRASKEPGCPTTPGNLGEYTGRVIGRTLPPDPEPDPD